MPEESTRAPGTLTNEWSFFATARLKVFTALDRGSGEPKFRELEPTHRVGSGLCVNSPERLRPSFSCVYVVFNASSGSAPAARRAGIYAALTTTGIRMRATAQNV
jgi:hypothetical protein